MLRPFLLFWALAIAAVTLRADYNRQIRRARSNGGVTFLAVVFSAA
jgi:hypothetical protein